MFRDRTELCYTCVALVRTFIFHIKFWIQYIYSVMGPWLLVIQVLITRKIPPTLVFNVHEIGWFKHSVCNYSSIRYGNWQHIWWFVSVQPMLFRLQWNEFLCFSFDLVIQLVWQYIHRLAYFKNNGPRSHRDCIPIDCTLRKIVLGAPSVVIVQHWAWFGELQVSYVSLPHGSRWKLAHIKLPM